MADPRPTVPPADGAAPTPTTSLHTSTVDSADVSATSASSFTPPPPSPSPGPPSPSPPSSSSSTPPLPPLSSALYDSLHPALTHCDTAIHSVFTSQSHLASHIDTLATLLTTFNSLHRTSSHLFTPYTAKLQSAKRRIKRLQGSVDRINSRLNELRDGVRRKEGLVGAGGVSGVSGRLSLSSIASMAQQALSVGSGGSGGLAVKVADEEEEEEEKEDGSVVGEMDSIETLVPVLDKSAAPTTYGSLPTSAPSPTSASSPTTAAMSETSNGTVVGGSAGGGSVKSTSLSSAPSSTVLLHDLLAWDGQ